MTRRPAGAPAQPALDPARPRGQRTAGLRMGRIVRALAWARSGDPAPAMTSAALAGLRVRDILRPGGPARAARGWQSVQSFLEGDSELGLAPAPPGVTAFAVRDFDGQLTGLVTRSQLSAVPRGRRAATRLSQAATPVDHLVFATLDEPLTALRARLNVRPSYPAAVYTAGHVLVLGADGELAGLLTPDDFDRAAQSGARRPAPPGRGGELG